MARRSRSRPPSACRSAKKASSTSRENSRTATTPTARAPIRAGSSPDPGALDPRELTFNRFSHRYGDPETEDWKVFANSVIPIGAAGTEVYGFAGYNDRQGKRRLLSSGQ